MGSVKQEAKKLLGSVPYLAEIDYKMRYRGKAAGGFKLRIEKDVVAQWAKEASQSPYLGREGKKVFLFVTLRYWLDHGALLSLGLAGLGHDVTLAFLPYSVWYERFDKYLVRQSVMYGRMVLGDLDPLVKVISLLDVEEVDLPGDMAGVIETISERDVQYTQQVEEVDRNGDLYQLRMERNTFAARAGLGWMKKNKPDVVLVPNGMILEFGAVYQAARYLGISAISFEFGEQNDQIWFSQDREVMMQDTTEMWAARKDKDFTEEQQEKIKELFASRQKADLWQNFSRQWQSLPSEGGEKAREKLGLDGRPIVLLAANVIGDSLTLGRQVFSENMTEWLEQTFEFFAERDGVQFVLRVHPGEKYLDGGPSVADIAERLLPDPPGHFHVVAWDAPINTYDLASIADLGLVYTTTTGMEMAMGGVPVIVSGQTHYSGKGFTLDPQNWDEYFEMLEQALANPEGARPSEEQVKTAWHYAYRFFFDYPEPFPWHMVHIHESMERWPMRDVLSEEGLALFGKTFAHLTGEKIDWDDVE